MATLTTVSSNYGTINGIQKDVYSVFRGIPFAKVPTGALRFAPPQKPESFKEAYDAFTFRSIPMQHFTDPDGLYQKEFYDNPDFHFLISEDCLYLNIWTPAHTASEKLPVAVWIHGGGFEHGFSTELEFDGEAYAKKGVILATISYRVNVFGFLYDQKQEKELGFSGNQGLLDQIAALEWISENIAAFGGNPDNITIMGQSAGAMSSHVLTFSPLATPMIHQAILQSGSIACFPSPMVFTKTQAQAVTDKFYELCGVSSIEELRRLPAEDLLDKSDELMTLYPSLPFRPVVDGHVLPDTPDVLTKEGGMARIPYLMGVTKDDLFIPEGASHREGGFFTAAVSFANACRKQNLPVYLYEFCHDLPGSDDGAFHSSELWYTFGTLNRCWRPMTDEDHALAEEMVTCWTSFMKQGDPNEDVKEEWKAWTEDGGFIKTFA